MPTDDERLEVAERLRVGADRQSDHTMSVYLCLAVLGDDFAERFNRGELRRELFDRLADLIDPDCDEGRYEGVHTARPVDRDALLALSGYLDAVSLCGWASGPVNVGEIARRIREACGESVA